MIIGTPHIKNSGYYMNDDTPSGGKKAESDIKTCTHCQKIIKLHSFGTDYGFCVTCMAPVCPGCAARIPVHGCEPFLKKIEAALEDEYHRKQFRKIAGLDPEGYVSTIFSGQR